MAFDPGSDHHNAAGDMIFNNRHEANEWAKKVNAATGRKIVVNPDGGIPGGSESDRQFMLQERREHAERVTRADHARAEEFHRRLRSRQDR